ncbi:type VI secretion system tip protein TssI/VgrG [Rugamonas sp. CCM 8940]|uniref:type VI secretion system tip protein TssI/VgrG n=1 Tax=Rugamonas sp. CCM 8940 TaxID=2765359 RepID=UPI0018F731BE|nr:type VI secretion system tip protein TssI/VgrG [Rugamonas sp. CCM 8940]MBJ7313464.1 type VI secretion system tip protein VgrG [Rugamonas sp. CCM 8940]
MSGDVLALGFSGAGGKLTLVGLHGEEAMGELFVYHLELFSADAAIDFSSVVGQSASASVTLADGKKRYFSGVISRFVQAGGLPGGASYRAELRPWLWWLLLEVDARIFQQKSAPEIITALFDEFGFSDYRNSLSGSYSTRDYCVQYNESAFHFVSRLMEEEGIFYYFEHAAGSHTLVLFDGGGEYPACTGLTSAHYQETGISRDAFDLVYRCEAEQCAVPAKFASGDFSFQTPDAPLSAAAEGKGGRMRVYEYPGGYAVAADGGTLATRRMQSLAQGRQAIRGDSSCRAFTAGHRFALAGHYRADLNAGYVLQRVLHNLSHDSYSNSFDAFPQSLPFRSPLRTSRARILGTQTATVVGKAGEEIWTDSFGRIKVQFHWDQRGKNDENSSCWIRVAQSWAGKGWGNFFLPRIGQEVVVSFLDGDPDRPLVTGAVYNATQTVPEPLPANQTRSTMRSRSSKDGKAGNELRFEDKLDAEELYLHAQKDMNTVVENCRSTRVVEGKDSLAVEKGERSVNVKGDEEHVNQANFTHKVTGNFTHQVTGNYELKVDGNLTITVAGNISIKTDGSFSCEAGTSLSNKSGTSLANNAGTTFANKAGTSMNNEAGTSLENKAGTTMVNEAGISLTNKGSASQTVDGGGMLTLKGGIVKIN